MEILEDNKIIDLFILRDETAVQHTADKFGKKLRALAFGFVRDEQTAEECENDTYMSAWNAIPPHEPRSYFFAFLARITRNIALNRCRKQSQLKRNAIICELSTEMEQCIPSPNDNECLIDDMALSEILNAFLGTLGSKKRSVFIRRYWYCDSIAEISCRFELSENNVKSILFRSRNKLREYLIKEGYDI